MNIMLDGKIIENQQNGYDCIIEFKFDNRVAYSIKYGINAHTKDGALEIQRRIIEDTMKQIGESMREELEKMKRNLDDIAIQRPGLGVKSDSSIDSEHE